MGSPEHATAFIILTLHTRPESHDIFVHMSFFANHAEYQVRSTGLGPCGYYHLDIRVVARKTRVLRAFGEGHQNQCLGAIFSWLSTKAHLLCWTA